MSTVDYIFLAGCVAALVLMLACSKVIRAIVWDTIRHPFSKSRIEVRDGEVFVRREGSTQAVQAEPKAPAGAR
jgi:hypothetical protein